MDANGDVQELQRCNSDLADIIALSKKWKGRDTTVIAGTLLEALLGMLDLDFAYLRLDDAAHAFIRIGQIPGTELRSDDVFEGLSPWLGHDPEGWPSRLSIGAISLSVAPLRLGIIAGIGLLVVGSRREGFPRQAEHLRLGVAASQATVAFREVRQLSDRQLPSDQRYRELTEEAVVENERKLDLIINTIPGNVWSTTADGMAEFFNQHHLNYVGSTFAEMRGLGFLSQFHPDDLPGLLRTWQGMMASKRGGDLEGRVRRADGEYRWSLMRASPLLDEEGNVIRWYGINTDIEDRKRAEDALRATEKALATSERNLNLIVDSLPALVWSSPPDGSADFVNKHYLDYVGLPRDQVLGWGFLDLLHPDDVENLVTSWKKQLSSDTATSQARMRRSDGQYRWFYFSGRKFTDASGNVRWFGVNTDIEDLKRAEDALNASKAALQKSERRLHQIINTIPGLAWSADPDGGATFVNQQYLDYTGLTLEQALGIGWTSIVNPDDVPRLLSGWQSMRESGRGGDVEARMRRHDGQYRWFLFRTNPLYDDAGNLLQWFGVNTDIEDRKRAQDALSETQAALARVGRLTAMGELTVSIAHEINQPLMAIVTNAGTSLRWLEDDQLDVSQARQAIQRIVRDGNRAGEIVASIRALARKSSPKMERMDLHEAILEVMTLMQGEFHRRDVRASADLRGGTCIVVGDRTLLQQVLMNLIMNSVEAMTDPACNIRRLKIESRIPSPGLTEVSISDTGPGFDLSKVDRMFEAFFTTKPTGIGMGLSICRSIIEAHGGGVWASQNQPQGSIFRFTVPLSDAPHGDAS